MKIIRTIIAFIQAGMGSAYGGQWKPKKPEDERFLGEPGEIKTTFKNGYRIDTKIGEDGRAVYERHYTDHGFPKYHTDPHDHLIYWDKDRGNPQMEPEINYPKEDYPDGAPIFKNYKGVVTLGTVVLSNSIEDNRFKTISDFKWCIHDGGEVQFVYHAKTYGIIHHNGKIIISEIYNEETEKTYNTVDELLEYKVDGNRLRDIITQAEIIDRTL
jgi:hypothetical protein